MCRMNPTKPGLSPEARPARHLQQERHASKAAGCFILVAGTVVLWGGVLGVLYLVVKLITFAWPR
jgi:hypothetical protein